jgi:hypothetical protein
MDFILIQTQFGNPEEITLGGFPPSEDLLSVWMNWGEVVIEDTGLRCIPANRYMIKQIKEIDGRLQNSLPTDLIFSIDGIKTDGPDINGSCPMQRAAIFAAWDIPTGQQLPLSILDKFN